jgi:hypothetical protein
MVRFNSAGRVQPIEGMYLVHPGTCFLCGKVPDNGMEYFANLGVELEYFGAAYLCQACCAEVADFIGFTQPEIHETILDMNRMLAEKNVELQKSLKFAKELLNARIDTAGSDQSHFDGFVSDLVLETESDSDYLDTASNRSESESSESSQG